MKQIFLDAITNVRMVMGTIRMDVMNIKGQTDDKKLQVEKTSEIIMSPAAFSQVLRTLQDVDGKLGYCNLAPIVEKTFNIMGITQYSQVFASEEEGLAELNS